MDTASGINGQQQQRYLSLAKVGDMISIINEHQQRPRLRRSCLCRLPMPRRQLVLACSYSPSQILLNVLPRGCREERVTLPEAFVRGKSHFPAVLPHCTSSTFADRFSACAACAARVARQASDFPITSYSCRPYVPIP